MKHEFEAVDKTLVKVFGKELDVVAAVVEGIADTVFYKFLSQIHIVSDVIERHLRLYHPEFRQVARSVRVFGAESRAESVDGSESGSSELAFKLTADSQRCRLAEEVT